MAKSRFKILLRREGGFKGSTPGLNNRGFLINNRRLAMRNILVFTFVEFLYIYISGNLVGSTLFSRRRSYQFKINISQ